MDTPTEVAVSAVEQLIDFHNRGQYLKGYELAQKMGPMQQWTGVQEQLIGGRLAYNLGSSRLGRVMHRAAFASEPKNPEVIYFHTMSMGQRRSALRTWQTMQNVGQELPGANDKTQSDWFALRACTLGILRDFSSAENWIERAIDLCPDRSWLYVCRTFLLEQQDRPEEALETAQRANELQPWYRPAVQNLADRLVQMNRDEEALALMREACTRLESGDVRCQLGALLLETQQYAEAREIYDGLEKFYPYMHLERKRPEWLAARRADTAYYCGDFSAASEHAKKADTPFYTDLAKKLSEENCTGKREILPVKFVRQNRLTCAPATLSAICDYWQHPVEHLEVVDKICFDGTPAHSERRWAENEGFVTREFRLTWEVALQLVDAGVPFTLATVDSGSGHLQAVIGYDSYRQSIIVRDPGERHFNEFETKKMLEHYASCGPRGMALVPANQADRLKGIEFPDAAMFDLAYQVDLALEAHNREEAEKQVQQMRQVDPEHRLTLRATGSLASYDANVNDLLRAANSLLEKYPDNVNFLITKLGCLNELGRRDDRIALLKEQIAKKDCDPMFWLRYAGELMVDAREHKNAMYYLHRGARFRPHDSSSFEMMASLALDRQQQDEALSLYRFAACINEMKESSSRSYFYAARTMNKTDEALEFIQDRYDRFSKKSSFPIKTLCWALEQMDRTTESFDVLNKGFQLRSDDGDLLLYGADFHGRYGKMEKAAELLEKAKGDCHRTDWLRAAALQDGYRGDLNQSLGKWMEVIEAEPLDSGAHRCAAELIADTQGPEEAIGHIKKYVDKFPQSYMLRMLLIDWLRQEDSDDYEPELHKFMELNPSDSWAMRELAFHELKNDNYDKAQTLIKRSEQIEPNHPASLFVYGRISQKQNQIDAAKEHYRSAVRNSVDYEFAILALMSCCETKEEREKELNFVYQELKRQTNNGDGLLTYSNYASQTFDAKTTQKRLEAALEARPDLWQAWTVMIRHLSDTQQHDEAIKRADEACKRFPLLPKMWIDRAIAHAACGDSVGEIDSLRRAKEINQNWGEPARLLSEAYEKKGDLDSARAEIEGVITSEPRDVRNHGFLASIMWQQGEKQQAVDRMVKALEMQPGYDWGWSVLRSWAAELKQHEMVINITKQLTQKRPKNFRSWLLYAESLGEREQIDQAVAALDKAIALSPLNAEGYNQKAYQLTRAGKFDEAIAAASPEALRGNMPIELESRLAWIEGERGNLDTAMKAMEKVVKRDPDYFWAWHRLAEWYDFSGQASKYHKASQEMTRLEPQNPVSWGYLGASALQRNNIKAAKQHFLQAVQLSPAYSFASGQLIDMQLHDKEYDEALATVDLISPHIGPAWELSEKARIESLRGDKEAAFKHLRQLCITPTNGSDAIDSAVESMYMAQWGEDVMPLIDEMLDHEDAQPGVAYVFINLGATLKNWDHCESRMEQLRPRKEIWREGAMKLLEEFATGDQHPRLHKFIAKYKKEFKADNEYWTSVGRAYNKADLHKKTLSWMKDWKKRKEVTAVMVFPVVSAFWHLDQPSKAMDVSVYSVRNYEPDESSGANITLMAFYELLHGSLESCVDAVGMVDPNALPRIYQIIFQHIVTILENLSVQGRYRALSKQLTGIWASLPEEANEMKFLKRTHQWSQVRAAQLHGKNLTATWLKLRHKFA